MSVQGYNSTLFVYGQTGSGKTHTMEGYEYAMAEMKTSAGIKVKTMTPQINSENNVGIAIRTIKEFFKQKANIKDEMRGRFFFYVSFFQIYNEMVFDLLNFDSQTVGVGGEMGSQGGRRYLSKQKELKVRYTGKDQFVVENLFLYECTTA